MTYHIMTHRILKPGSLAALFLALAACASIPSQAEEFTLEVEVSGETRSAIIELPDELNTTPAPLIMIFHGGGGSAARMQSVSGDFATRLRDEGYVIAFMNGSARRNTRNLRTWNADHCCAYAAEAGINDAAYVDAVYEALVARTPINEDQIHLFGHSNGAMLIYRIASDLSFTPDAIVIVSGAMFADQPPFPEETSVFSIHTRDDKVLSFSGDDDRSERYRTAPILAFENVRDRLETLKNCPSDLDLDIYLETFIEDTPCDDGSSIVTFTLSEGGHEWPKNDTALPLEDLILSFLASGHIDLSE